MVPVRAIATSIGRINTTATTNQSEQMRNQRKRFNQAKFQIKAVATKRIIFLVQNLKTVGRDFTPPVQRRSRWSDGRWPDGRVADHGPGSQQGFRWARVPLRLASAGLLSTRLRLKRRHCGRSELGPTAACGPTTQSAAREQHP